MGGEERSSSIRNRRFDSPVFKADYRAGNYLPVNFVRKNTHLIVSIIERTGGLRKGAWFFSPDFYTAFRDTVSQFLGT